MWAIEDSPGPKAAYRGGGIILPPVILLLLAQCLDRYKFDVTTAQIHLITIAHCVELTNTSLTNALTLRLTVLLSAHTVRVRLSYQKSKIYA